MTKAKKNNNLETLMSKFNYIVYLSKDRQDNVNIKLHIGTVLLLRLVQSCPLCVAEQLQSCETVTESSN